MSDSTRRPRKYLFIHQNFPGQFVHLANELARLGHEVVALGITGRKLEGVRYIPYRPEVPPHWSAVEQAKDFEVKVVRGMGCALAMDKLKKAGFNPDCIVAHPGWGEALFCKDVWPLARLVVFAEFFYSSQGADYNFDPEFSKDHWTGRARLRVKNSVHLLALHAADAVYTPTKWQLRQMPTEFQHKARVIFDGIDTAKVAPSENARVDLMRDKINLTGSDEVLTYVSRNLEPYRGFHTFMRALPNILWQRPNAHCLIVGQDDVSYGAPPKEGGTWRQKLLAEVRDQLPMDRVHFLGRLNYQDYLRVLQISKCHVYMTYPFVMSWSCVEALSAGRVVVASNTGPVQEFIKHGENGLLFDFFDRNALVSQVVDVLATPQAYSELGLRARQTVIEGYDLHNCCLPKQIDLVGGFLDLEHRLI